VPDHHSLGIIWLKAKSVAVDSVVVDIGGRGGGCWKCSGTHFHSCSLNTFDPFRGVVRRSLKLIIVVEEPGFLGLVILTSLQPRSRL
jgi:hypothetical protein